MKKLTIGICSVSTRPENYLLVTIASLVDNIGADAQQAIQIVLFDCDATPEESPYIGEIRSQFSAQIESGMIEIVRTSPNDYPQLDNLQQTLGDTAERIRWRSKQNLDFSLIFRHCVGKAPYYLHLDDDVLCAKDFDKKVLADIERFPTSSWSSMQFGDLGTIGILLKDQDLPRVADFLCLFFDELPSDWIMEYFYAMRRRQGREFIQPKRLLFKHIGHHSSLPGKIGVRCYENSVTPVSIHDHLWKYKGTRGISRVISRGTLIYRHLKTRAKRLLKPDSL